MAYLDQMFGPDFDQVVGVSGPDVDHVLTRIYTVYSSTGTEKYSVQLHRDGELIKNLQEAYYKPIRTYEALKKQLGNSFSFPYMKFWRSYTPPRYGREELTRIPGRN